MNVFHRAIHEAGHTVVGCSFGWTPEVLRVVGDDQRADFWIPNATSSDHNFAVMLVGGPVALTIVGLSVEESVSDGFGFPDQPESDYARLVDLGYDPHDPGLWSEAETILRDRFFWVRRVAVAVLKTPGRVLYREDLAELFRTA